MSSHASKLDLYLLYLMKQLWDQKIWYFDFFLNSNWQEIATTNN